MKIAFIFRGHWREWDNSKHGFLRSLERLSKTNEVVVFIATWARSNYGVGLSNHGYLYRTADVPFDRDSVYAEISSTGVAIGGIHVSDEQVANSKIPSTPEDYGKIAYLRTIGNSLKVKYEITHDLLFDLVIETRTDLFFVIENTDLASSMVKDGFVEAQCYFPKSSNLPVSDKQSMVDFVGDLYFRMNSTTADVFNSAFHSLLVEKPLITLPVHHIMGTQAEKYNLTIYQRTESVVGLLEILRPVVSAEGLIDFKDLTEDTREKIERNRKAFDFIRSNISLAKKYLKVIPNE